MCLIGESGLLTLLGTALLAGWLLLRLDVPRAPRDAARHPAHHPT